MAPCVVNNAVMLPSNDMVKDSDEADVTDRVHDMAEVVAGYLDCMAEAVRYLVEVERYPECHPAVEGLRQHLADYQRHLVGEALTNCGKSAEPTTKDLSLNPGPLEKDFSLDSLNDESWPV